MTAAITGFKKKMRNPQAYPALRLFKSQFCKVSTRYGPT